MKLYIDDRKRQFIRAVEQCSKMQENLQNALQELARCKQTYEQSLKDSERASQKYEEMMRVPTGTIKRLVSVSHTKARLDEARKRQKSAAQKAQNARNEYLLNMEAYRIHQVTYDTYCLPDWMRQVDGTFFDVLTRYYTRFADAETQNAKDLLVIAANISTCASMISRDQECADFIAESAPAFNALRPISLELLASDKENKIAFDDVSKVVLSNKLAQQMNRRDQVEAALAKNEKSIEGVKRLTLVYEDQPAMGNASSTQEEEERIYQSTRALRVEKAKLDAIIKALVDSGGAYFSCIFFMLTFFSQCPLLRPLLPRKRSRTAAAPSRARSSLPCLTTMPASKTTLRSTLATK